MAVTEQIRRQVQRLPEAMQAEVLHFVEFLLTRAAPDDGRQEEREWSALSLGSALRGLEDEGGADYSEADLKERFS